MDEVATAFIKQALLGGLIVFDLKNGFLDQNGNRSPYQVRPYMCSQAGIFQFVASACSETIEELDEGQVFRPDVIIGCFPWGYPIAATVSSCLADDYPKRYGKLQCGWSSLSGSLYIGGRPMNQADLASKRVLVLDMTHKPNTISRVYQEVALQGGIPVGCVVGFDELELHDTNVSTSGDFGFTSNVDGHVHPVATIEDLVLFLSRGRRERHRRMFRSLTAYRKSCCREMP